MRMPITKINTERLFTPHTSQRHPNHDHVDGPVLERRRRGRFAGAPESRPLVSSTRGAAPASSTPVVISQVASSPEMPRQAARR